MYKPPFLLLAAALIAVSTLVSSPIARAEPLQMASGWSTNPAGGAEAAREAIEMMRESLPAPKFIVLYTTANYKVEEIVATLRSELPDAKLFGISTYKGVFTADGLHIGENGSLAIMGFAGGDHAFGVGACAMSEGSDVAALTKQALADAAQDAGRSPQDTPALILLGAMKGTEDAAVLAIGEVVPQGASLVGGTQCDDGFSQGYVIGNDEVYRPGTVVAAVYTKHKVGASFYSGFVGRRKSGVVTAGTGRSLKEIDGRPAQEVYGEWAGGAFDHIDASQESKVVLSTAVCPMAKALEMPDGELRYVLLQPWRFDPGGQLTVGCNIHVGETVCYVEGNKRALRKRAGAVVTDAMVQSRIKVDQVVGGLHIYCRGAANTLGFDNGDEVEQMVAEINKSMKGRPFIGAFTAGEQGSIPGYGFFHGNLMSSGVVFSE